jgi:protease PrsW
VTAAALGIETTTILVAAVFLVLVVAAVWWFDRYDREPLGMVAVAFGWGALAAPALAAVSETIALGVLRTHYGRLLGGALVGMGVGPFAEEAWKAVGLLAVVALSPEFDNPTDGLVYGTAVGLGFATTENLLYDLTAAASGDLHRLVVVAAGRTLITAGVHALCSATLGGMLGFALLSRSWLRRFALVASGLGVAVGLHAAWNTAVAAAAIGRDDRGVVFMVGVLLALYLLYVVLLAALLHGEHRILQVQLSEEVKLGVLPVWVADVLPFYRRRVRGAWWSERSERTVIARLVTRLAFRKHALRHLPADEARLAGLEVMRLRQRIRSALGFSGVAADHEIDGTREGLGDG